MTDAIRVHVVRRKGLNLCLRYADPVTGKRCERSSGSVDMKSAYRAAAQWEVELNAGGTVSHCHITWQDFRDLFLEEYVAHRSASYTIAVSSTFNVVEKLMNPDKLSRISATWLSRFKVVARNRQKSSATIHKYMQHLKTALTWACDQGYLQSVPKFPKEIRSSNKRKRHMKGRPLTESEFTRMPAAVRDLVRNLRNKPFLLRSDVKSYYASIDPNTGWASGSVVTAAGGGAMVPEPSSIAMFGIGALGLLGYGRRRRQTSAAA